MYIGNTPSQNESEYRFKTNESFIHLDASDI